MTPIKAIYNGIQDGPQPFELWTILEPMGCTCHGQFSSLSINTIHAHGIGFYLAYRLMTWFETGRIHTEQQDFRPNIKRVK